MIQLSLLPPDMPADHRKPREPIARAAAIDGNYRWSLHRRWGAGPTVGWGMLNPSDAGPVRDDPTLWRIMGFSFRWGFGGLVVGNQYPFISANQAALRRWRSSWGVTETSDASAREAYIRNLSVCGSLFAECDLVISAWGNGADPDDVATWLEQVEHYAARPLEWRCLGRNADGSPKHPLARGVHRVPDDQKPQPWRSR